MANCVVFGGTGFIGKHLVSRLIAEGHKVTVFARTEGGRDFFKTHPKLDYYFGDFFNIHDLDEATKNKEYVFHLVSLTNPAISEEDPYIDLDTNVRMTLHLFDACVKNKVKRVIYTSSGGSIYGEANKKMLSESDPTFPMSPYAIGKQTVEGYLRYYNKKHQLDYLAYRISNVYGKGQNTANNKHGVISVFLQKILADEPLTVYGDGTMTRDYIDVHDLTSFMSQNFNQSTRHKLYNIGSGVGVTVNEILRTIETVTSKKSQITHLPVPASYVKDIVLDCSRSREEFGEIAHTPLVKGISSMYDEYLAGN